MKDMPPISRQNLMETTDSKPAKAPRKAAAKATAAPAAAEPGAEAPNLRKKDLVEKVSAALGAKKGSVKDVVDATLVAIAASLKAGETLTMPPLGRIKVIRSMEKGEGKGSSMTIRITTGGGKKPAAEALADAGEEG